MKVNSIFVFQFVVLICLVLVPVRSAGSFCHITCGASSCNSQLSTRCTSCSTYFIMAGPSPNSCNFDTTLTTVKLSKKTSDFTLSSAPRANCSAAYQYYGEYLNNTAITISTLSPVIENHYQVQLIVWIILIDNWSSGYVNFKISGTGQNYSISQNNGSGVNTNFCYSTNSDSYVRFSSPYTHSDTMNSVSFEMTSVIGSSSGKFGIGDIYLVAKLCHPYCKLCSGPTSDVCTQCVTGYFLSGTTCALNCLTGYGPNLPSNVCIVCHQYCLQCNTIATNCTVCKNTILVGATVRQIYKVQDQNSCLITCSSGYYSYLATKQCLLCSVHCVNMTINSQLNSLNTSLQFLYTFTQAMDFSTFNYATFLGFTSNNASINPATDLNIVYQAVDNKNFKLTLTAKPGVYLVNNQICTKILPQATNPYQYSQLLNKINPSVYTLNDCKQWSTPQAGLTITSQVDSSKMFGEFFFTFTDSMKFTGFSWSNFVYFNSSDSSLDIVNDFTVTYTQIDATTFKLKLAPNPMVYFTDTTFCAITKSQSLTSLQFSLNNYKLNSAVYNAYSCIFYSTPKVSLSLSNYLDTNRMFAQFTFTFNESMDFTSFVWNDFTILNENDTMIDVMADFTILYTPVNLTTFKLKLTPNLGLYFANTTFCAVTLAEALATLQFSSDLYKLDPSVYGQSSCLLWSIPIVNMTIQSQILQFGSYVDFTFKFDSSMDLLAFDYTDFLNFSLKLTDYNLAKDFTINYTVLDDYSFKLQITPLQEVMFSNLDFCISSNLRNNTQFQISKNNYTLSPSVYDQKSCLIWSTPLPSVFTRDEKEYFRNLEIFNNQLQQITTQKGTQQIIKSGAFAFLMPGAQLSTTVLLNSPRISQNLYEGSRFWGSFIFFDVPPYQQGSNKTKYTFSLPNKDILNNIGGRRLQQFQSNNFVEEWRFDRTGHTGFFIFDTYIQLIMIGLSWVLILIVWIYQKKCQPKSITLYKTKARVMAFFHKVHEVSFFYLVLSGLIQYRNFDISHSLHLFSIIVASFFLLYYLVYELKVFYDMINYPKTKIGTRTYQQFVQNYGIYLAYYRFEEYNDRGVWNWRHFFRPYNYHTLSFIKKALMLTAVPIFYDHGLWPVIILTLIQFLDVVRFALTLPYQSNYRNLFYFFLESLLFIFFLCSWINQVAGQTIYDSNGIIISMKDAITYKNSGWLGMIVLFLYNILYVLSNFVEFGILLFTKSSIQNMIWSNRNSYYQQLYDHFQNYGSYYRLVKNYTEELAYNTQRREARTLKGWVNKFHRAEPFVDLSDDRLRVFKEINERGNIFTTQFDNYFAKEWVQVKIQTYKIKDFQRIIRLYNFNKRQLAPKNQDGFINHQTQSSYPYKKPSKNNVETQSMKNFKVEDNQERILNFQIEYQIIPEVFITDPLKHQKTKGYLYVPNKIKNKINSYALNPHFQKNLAMTLISYQIPGTQQVRLQTILRIHLRNYQQGQRVIYKKQNMRQQIVIKRGRLNHKIELKEMIQGFPADWQSLQKRKQNQKSSLKENQMNETQGKLLRIEI